MSRRIRITPSLLISMALALVFSISHVQAASVVLGTKFGGSIGGISYGSDDLVLYDTVADTASIYLDGSSIFTAIGQPINFDALSIRDNGNLVFSMRRPAQIGSLSFAPWDMVEYDVSTGTASLFHPSFGPDFSAVKLLDNGNYLFATKWASTIAGLSYDIGDVIEYDPVAGTASIFFSTDLWDKDTYATPNIDAVELLPNGNILLSATNTVELAGVKFKSADIIEYSFSSGVASLWMSEDVFASTRDLKALSFLPSVSAVPVPPSLGLLLIGLFGLFFKAKHRSS